MEISHNSADVPDHAAQAQFVAAMSDLPRQASQAMDETNEQLIASNDRSSDAAFADIKDSRETWLKIVSDPNSSEEEKKFAMEKMAKLDDNAMEIDRGNKKWSDKLGDRKAQLLMGVATGLTAVAVAVATNGKIQLPRR